MVVDWERVAKKAGKFFLLLLEYCIKLSAVAVTAVVLVADGGLGMKLGTGFGSISPTLRTLFEAPGDIVETAHLINEYHNLSATVFEARYGAGAMDGVLSYLNGGIVYLQDVSQNFASHPFSTFFASLIAFGSLYLISLILRFARQKGQGSYLNRLERRLGERVFEDTAKKKREKIQQTAGMSNGKMRTRPQTVNKVKKTFGGNSDSNKVNKHLQDYLKSAQSG